MPVDPRKFLLNTDYEMDKIIYFTEGHTGVTNTPLTISHGLGFAPLIFGVCAFNSDFTDSRSIPYNYTTASDSISFTVEATDTDIQINYSNTAQTPDDFYYRIYAFEPSNSTATVPPTNSSAKEFVLNTDYNYCKLFQKGILNGDSTVTHNLGYIPQVLAWSEESNIIIPIEESTPVDPITNTPQYITVTNTSIQTVGYTKVHYRIYYDEE